MTMTWETELPGDKTVTVQIVHHNPQWLAWEWPWASVVTGQWLSQPCLGPGGILWIL